MPFTPFHLGPGLATKALAGRRFSFMVFGGTQVLMDIEPLVRLYLNTPVVHGYTHTLPGALIVGIVAALSGKPISSFVLSRLDIPHYPLTWSVSWASALIGSLSHVILDAIMHDDVEPLWPFTRDNRLLHLLSVTDLHLLCLGLGVFGALGVLMRFVQSGKA
jgi:membrane-bound metal-dependent hydrolase YbcI (DUF457 family)